MSLETWRKEYYPEDADKIKSRSDRVLIEASLLKWIGLQKGNLAEHGLKKDSIPYKSLELFGEKLDCHDACSLCTKYHHGTFSDKSCVHCPLGNCGYSSPYGKVWQSNYTNLTPLIEALAKALDKELDND